MIEVEEDQYKNIRPHLRTGDIVLFKDVGVSSIISCVEFLKTGCDMYTHIGIIIMSNSFPVGSHYRLCGVDGHDYAVIPYIFESTQSGVGGDGSSDTDGRRYLGVQLRKFDDVIETYGIKPKTKIVIGKLKSEYVINDQKLYDTVIKYNHTRYQLNVIQLFSSVFKVLRRVRFLCDVGIFCSELVAIVLKENGILDDTVNPKNCLPVSFVPNNAKVTYDPEKKIPVLIEKLIEIQTTKTKQKKQVSCLGF